MKFFKIAQLFYEKFEGIERKPILPICQVPNVVFCILNCKFCHFCHLRIEILQNCSAFLRQFLSWEKIWGNWEKIRKHIIQTYLIILVFQQVSKYSQFCLYFFQLLINSIVFNLFVSRWTFQLNNLKIALYLFISLLGCRAQLDWAYEFLHRTGPDIQTCRTGPAGLD